MCRYRVLFPRLQDSVCKCGIWDSSAISTDTVVCRTRTFLKDIDVTMDYAGSFDKEEVINYMVTNHDFWCQGAVEDATKTILDKSNKVGQNCLRYMETINGMSTRWYRC